MEIDLRELHPNLQEAVGKCKRILSSPPILRCPHCGKVLIRGDVFPAWEKPHFELSGGIRATYAVNYYCPITTEAQTQFLYSTYDPKWRNDRIIRGKWD